MQTAIEYEPIVKKILEKSEKGKLDWSPSIGGFSCSLDGQYTFRVSRYDDVYQLSMQDSQKSEIFSIVGKEAVVYGDASEEEMFNLLRDIFERARRKALRVDEKIATAASLLDSM